MAMVGYVGSVSSSMLQSILDMRERLDDLQRQFGTGVKSDTYAGLGADRGISLSLRGQISAISGYDAAMAATGIRLTLAQSALTGIDNAARTVKTAAIDSAFSIDPSGQSTQQKGAMSQLDLMLGLLGTQAGDRSLFSGKAVDKPAVASTDLIINGDGIRAGLKQMIAERKLADLGASGLGRLNVTNPVAGTMRVAEDVGPFGFKLAAVNSSLSNATVTGPAGAPPRIDVAMTGQPAAGQTIAFSFNLPDGTSQSLTLTATTASPPGPDQFTIGANATATAANLGTALTASLSKLAATSLVAASAMAASDNFFNTAGGNPPQRVNGPPFDTATSLTAGTPADTVVWYTGDDGADPSRGTAAVQIDPSVSVSYGMRANEQALRLALQNVAAFAASTFLASDPNAKSAYTALGQRVAVGLAGAPGQQKVSDISSEIATAQTAFQSAQARHQQTSAQLQDLLGSIETVPQEQVGAQILSLQTNLQASLQTTAMLAKMSLVNFI